VTFTHAFCGAGFAFDPKLGAAVVVVVTLVVVATVVVVLVVVVVSALPAAVVVGAVVAAVVAIVELETLTFSVEPHAANPDNVPKARARPTSFALRIDSPSRTHRPGRDHLDAAVADHYAVRVWRDCRVPVAR